MKSFMLFLCFLSLFAGSIADAASRQPVRASRGMVVSAESLATAAGVEILRSGGNAIDAAVAVGFMLSVTYPEAGNLGGGGFMLIRFADGRTTMIDFREKAPSAASRTMYLDESGRPIGGKSLVGPLAAGVPGTPAGLLLALQRYGTKTREEVLRPAAERAQRGVRVDEHLASALHAAMVGSEEDKKGFALYASSVKAFTRGGQEYREGDTLRQPDLARTLEAIRERGADGFYRGRVADLLVAEMQRSGGLITHADLSSYEAVERKPVRGSYRGYEIISASPPSAGGVVLLQVLNMLERFDLRAKGPLSSQAVHLFAAAAQRAYADRAEFLGDPDFVSIPVQTLVSKSYTAARSMSLDSLKAVPSERISAGEANGNEGHHTTHYCVADSQGNLVSVTVTLNDLFGCKTVVDGAGFFLNDEMDDFVVKPGVPNDLGLTGGEANAIAPSKRMLSSMTPTIVLKDRKPFLVVGARGGGRITTAVAQVIINVVDFGMNIQEAVDAPRVHHQWLPDKILYEPRALATDVVANLQKMGYRLEALAEPNLGKVEAILIDPQSGCFYGGPDPRENGVALGF